MSQNPNARRQYFDVPPVRYVGSKWKIADWIINRFPPHEVYVEPYCGSASIFFRKFPSPLEVLNDLDGELVNFFRVLRSDPDALMQAIELTPYSREEYYLSLEPAPVEDTLERARRFYTAAWQSFGQTMIYRSGWARNKSTNSRSLRVDSWKRMDGLLDAVTRLRDAQIESKSAVDVILEYDSKDTLFYIDPPYVLSARATGKRRRYRHEMTDEQHRELAQTLYEVDGMVILSGYHSELYDELFADWTCYEKSVTTNGNSQSTEVLWLSPRAADLASWPLFENLDEE